MCRTRHSWKGYLVCFNLWAVLYVSWAFGIFPFIYDSKAQRLRRSRWLIAYGVLLQAGLMFVIFHDYSPLDDASKLDLYQRNPLAQKITFLHYILITAAACAMNYRNWWMSKKIKRTLNALKHLHESYFKQYDSLEISTFDNFILWKGVAIFLEVISMMALENDVSPQLSLQFVMGLISILVWHLSILLIGMHFHLALIYIYRFVWIINRELLQLVYRNRLPLEIHQLHCIYRNLLDLNLQLVSSYECLTVLFISSILTANIQTVYYFLVYAHNLKGSLSYVWLNITQVVLINLIDFWLHIAVCEMCVRASRGTSTILKLFTDVSSQDVELNRNVRFENEEVYMRCLILYLFSFRSMIFLYFAAVDVLNSIIGDYLMWTMQWDFA